MESVAKIIHFYIYTHILVWSIASNNIGSVCTIITSNISSMNLAWLVNNAFLVYQTHTIENWSFRQPQVRPEIVWHHHDWQQYGSPWISILHKNPHKNECIAVSACCSAKSLPVKLKKLFTVIREGLRKCCGTVYSRRDVNQM